MSTTTLDDTLSFPPPAEESIKSQAASETRAAARDVSLTRLPSLDGWRAISIVQVLGCHTVLAAGFPAHLKHSFYYVFDGTLGVRFFFVVSGLLITWLMLAEERKTQKVNLLHFYIRRALRILPVYLAFLVVMGVIQYFTPCDHSLGNWISNLTFTRNFYLDGKLISGHLWSLAVEEQFYLIWPFVFIWLAPAVRTKAMPWITVGAILTAISTRLLWAFPLSDGQAWSHIFQQSSFFNNVDSLAIGCMAAIWLASDERGLRTFFTSRRILLLVLSVLMLGEPRVMHWLAERPWMPSTLKSLGWFSWFGLGHTIQSIGFVILVLQSILLPSWGLYRCLNWRPVAAIGALSYSIYIWQQIFFMNPADFGLPSVWWMTYPLWLIPAFIAAIISYHCLEKPFFNLRHRFR